MYVGRIVSIGMNQAGQVCGLYRVSSRSFPNREARQMANSIAIVPKPGHEDDIYKNPYIAYNCLRLVGRYGVVTNGSHTDIIADKLGHGMSMRETLISVLAAMDYEHDSLNTPRIAGIVDREAGTGCLGIVRHDALHVTELPLSAGVAWYVATYEHNVPGEPYVDRRFAAATAAEACAYILGKGVFAELERPVSAVCLVATADGFATAAADAPQA